MSKYTTGEIAKLCGVSVRTVQYYDKRGILVPEELSEGGRRLYSDDDLQKLKIICFLRDLDISINSISEILAEEEPKEIISLLIKQQENTLISEIEKRQEQIKLLRELLKSIKKSENFSVKSIGDVAYQMKNQKNRKKALGFIIAAGILIDVIEIAGISLWIVKGVWLPFVIGMIAAILFGIWASNYYMEVIAYICPKCHKVFKPTKKEMFFAAHTPKTRKLRCACCGYKGYCVETSAVEMMEK